MVWLLSIPLLVLPFLEWWLMIRLRFPLPLALFWSAATALAGWRIARGVELELYGDLLSDLRNNRLPTEEGLDAMFILLGGWGLIIPGLITDITAILLLLPSIRRQLVPWARAVLAQGYYL